MIFTLHHGGSLGSHSKHLRTLWKPHYGEPNAIRRKEPRVFIKLNDAIASSTAAGFVGVLTA